MLSDSMGSGSEWGLEQGTAAIVSVLLFRQCCHILRIPRQYLKYLKKRCEEFRDYGIVCFIYRKLSGQSIVKYSEPLNVFAEREHYWRINSMSLLRPKFIKPYFYENVMELMPIKDEKGLT